MKIFGMGGLELVIILVVILIIFGPKNLPKLGNALGKTVSNLREGMSAGKKKDTGAEEGETAEAEADPVQPQPAVISGTVEEGDGEVDDEFAKAEESVDEIFDEVFEETAEAAEDGSAAGEAPKKVVRRVVKKRVVTEDADPVEAE